jgi:hypothetical protein
VLNVTFSEFRRENPYEVGMNDYYALFVTRVLQEMPNLKSFQCVLIPSDEPSADLGPRWEDETFEESYGPSLILRNPGLLRTLKGCQTLRNLSLQFASLTLDDPIAAQNCFTSLIGFRNLASLELYQLYGDEKCITTEVALVVSECPGLKILGLGWACEFEGGRIPEVLVLEDGSQFFERLCLAYESRGKAPLALHTLRLGAGICPSRSTSKGAMGLFAGLVNVSRLKVLHIYNGLIKYGSPDAETDLMEVNWALFQDCTSLHQLSISRIQDDVVEWLNNVAKSVQELIVTEHYGKYDRDLDNFRALNLPYLSMIATREMMVSDRADDEGLWETESSEFSESESSLSDTASWGSPSDGDSSPSNPRPDKSIISILDRLGRGASQLTRLNLGLDFETQWVRYKRITSNTQECTDSGKGSVFLTLARLISSNPSSTG